ncbi:MAG: molybdate ABC transporter permease subunit [Solirubrobacteraceae bacterium]
MAGAARGTLGRTWFQALLALSVAVVLTFLALPVVAVFVHSSPGRLLSSLAGRESLQALRLSLETTLVAAGVIAVIGTPAAYLLATRPFRGRELALTVIELPLVLPPAVAGIGLLVALGPHGLLGGTLRAAHVELVFQTAGVVVALVFVSAPLFVRQAHSAFRALERTHVEAALALGATPVAVFLRIAIPIARPALLAGLALAWARAVGEFGATLMFAGSFPGVTQTAPLAIYDRFATDLPGALALSAVLVVVAAVVLGAVKLFDRPAVAA